jgi:RNA polymerase sigma-70 factor (sigma-E family)
MGVQRRPDFDCWFLEFYPEALRLATRILGNATGGEDLAAEAFSRALSRWEQVQRLEYRDAWLLRVVTNLAIDQLRRNPPATSPPYRPDQTEQTDERLAVLAALRKLPRQQRQAVVLRYFGEFSVAEVASVLEVSAGTVKTHLRRGLAGLRADPALIGEEGQR